MLLADLPIDVDPSRVESFCKSRGIRKLSVFGSALRDDFDPNRSDIDILAEFEPGALDQVGLSYFTYGQELSEILGHKVDFCSRLNRHIESIVAQQAVPIYERA